MPKPPQFFFIPPDSDLITGSELQSYNVPTDLFGGNCVADAANKGALSAFMIGDPASETKLNVRVNQSGNQGQATYIWKDQSSSSSWYGEPDRRWEWDRHNFLLSNTSQANSAITKNYWLSTQSTGSIRSIDMKGVYLSKLSRELVYLNNGELEDKIGIYYRDVGTVGTGDLVTETETWTTSEVTGLKTGTKFAKDLCFFDVCEHTDGKLKLVVINDADLDIYESEDGLSWTLICEMTLSRFTGFRLGATSYKQVVKIASSGAYLKIVFNSVDIIEKLKSKDITVLTDYDSLDQFLSMSGVDTGWDYFTNKSTYGNFVMTPTIRDQLSTPVNTEYEHVTPYQLGSVTSPDGGATWVLSDIPSSRGSNLPCYKSFGWDLTGLSDGSGQFILMFMAKVSENPDRKKRTLTNPGQVAMGIPPIYEYEDDPSPIEVDIYMGAISAGVSNFLIHENLNVSNIWKGGRPYICCNNDWIWFLNASAYSSTMEDWSDLNNENLYSFNDYNTPLPGTSFNTFMREHQMYFIHLDSDPAKADWKPLGSHDVFADFYMYEYNPTTFQKVASMIFESVTTGAVGSMVREYDRGNLYSCGPYIAWIKCNRSTLASYDNAPYCRFSGWDLRPPNATNGELNSGVTSRTPFDHQQQRVMSKPEFNYQWGLPAAITPNGGTTTTNSTMGNFPTTMESLWKCMRSSDVLISDSDNQSIRMVWSSPATNAQSYFMFVDPAVLRVNYWRSPFQNGYSSDLVAPTSLVLYSAEYPDVVWVSRPVRKTFMGVMGKSRFHGSAACFTIGQVDANASFQDAGGAIVWNEANNDLGGFTGVKIRSYISGEKNIQNASLPHYGSGIRLLATEVQVQFTSTQVRVYLPYCTSLLTRQVIILTPDPGTYGATPFLTYFWECRLAFNTQDYTLANAQTDYATYPHMQLSIRKVGSSTWIDSGWVRNKNYWVASTTYDIWKAVQFAAIGIFKDTSGSPTDRTFKIKDFRIVRDNDLGIYNMTASGLSDNEKADHIRGRSVYSLPVDVKDKQSIVWGGAAGYESDEYTYITTSNYKASNPIKYASPQIQYRTVGNLATVKTSGSKVELVVKLPLGTAASTQNKAFFHNSFGLLGINAETVSLYYSSDSAFSSPYHVFTSTTKVATCRITEQGHNNYIKVNFDGLNSVDSNFSKYSLTKNNTYYAKFSSLTAGVSTAIDGLSYTIKEHRGNYLLLDIDNLDLESIASPVSALVGTTVQIFSDTIASMFSNNISSLESNPKYLKVKLENHLGTSTFYKIGSMVAGMTYGFQNVPLNWEHNVDVAGNVTSFKSKSGIRWGYEEGPSVKTMSAVIAGDTFEQERENILKIMQNATQFNNRPILMIFDGDKSSAPDSGDASTKIYVDPTNMLYGTLDQNARLVNPGWAYDDEQSKWVQVGDMEITVTETV